ncbi:MAG: Ig-like domain-containing protein, partial [Bacilli bacterium]
NDSTYVKTMTVDLYGFLNSAVYVNGNLVTGVDGTPTSNGNSKVLTYTINSNNWYIIGNSSDHDQFFYSILFNIGTDPALLTPVTSVSLNESSVNLNVNDTVTLVATVSPDEASNKNISWSSSNEEVATVTGGVVTAIAAGNATITVTTSDGSFTATCSIVVSLVTPPAPQGCKGSIAITSSLIAVLSAIGVTFILIKRKKYSR